MTPRGEVATQRAASVIEYVGRPAVSVSIGIARSSESSRYHTTGGPRRVHRHEFIVMSIPPRA